MARKILRLMGYLSITTLVLFVVLRFVAAEPALHEAYGSCATDMNADCLIRLGIAEGLRDRSLPPYVFQIDRLAQIWYDADALDLEIRVQEYQGLAPEAARIAAERRLAYVRVTAAIKSGQTPQAALAQTPQADVGALWIAGLDLLGQQPFGPENAVIPPDATARDAVSDITTYMAELPADQGARYGSGLVYAAELQTLLENRAEVIRILDMLPVDGQQDFLFSEELMRLVGPHVVLGLCRGSAECRERLLTRAALAAPDAESARLWLEEAFSIHAAREPWPDFTEMAKVVRVAVDCGDPDFALTLARRIVQMAETQTDAFPAFSHIAAARALFVAGAEPGDVRASLDLAEAAFPGAGEQVIGLGSVSGPILWGGSGIGAQARREIANLRAKLGDTDGAIRLMDGMDQPDFAWRDIVTPDLSVATIDVLLQAPSAVLTAEDDAYVRACLARDILLADPPQPQRDWATATVERLGAVDLFAERRPGSIYGCVADAAKSLDNRGLYKTALEQMGRAALDSGDFVALLGAGIAWHDFEASGRE